MSIAGIIAIIVVFIIILIVVICVIIRSKSNKEGSVFADMYKEEQMKSARQHFIATSGIYDTKSDKLFTIDSLYILYLNNLMNSVVINNYEANAIEPIRSSLSKRVKQVMQPKGGYLPISKFQVVNLKDDFKVTNYKNKDQEIFSKLINEVVNSISMYLYTNDFAASFRLAIRGIFSYINDYKEYSIKYFRDDELTELMLDFKSKITTAFNFNLDDEDESNNYEIIRNIFTVCQFEVIARFGYEPYKLWKKSRGKKIEVDFKSGTVIPDYICRNVIIFIKRTLEFYKNLNKIDFGELLYNSELISSGSCDFISKETLWKLQISQFDFKNNRNIDEVTLKLIISYLMIKNNTHYNSKNYSWVSNVGIFNPYINSFCIVYDVVEKIDPIYIKEIEEEVIGFNWEPSDGFRIENYKYLVDIANKIANDEESYVKFYSRYNYKLRNKIKEVNKVIKEHFNN